MWKCNFQNSQNFLTTHTRNFKIWETLRGDERLKLNWRHKRVPPFFKAKSHQALILCSAAVYSAVTLVAEFSVRMQSWYRGSWLTVSKSWKQIMVSWILPKNEWNSLKIVCPRWISFDLWENPGDRKLLLRFTDL